MNYFALFLIILGVPGCSVQIFLRSISNETDRLMSEVGNLEMLCRLCSSPTGAGKTSLASEIK